MTRTGARIWDRHPHVRSGSQLSVGERAADMLKAAFGTWTLLGLIIGGIIVWLALVTDPGELHLNLGLSFLASVQGVILQIAANRGDRISAEVATGTHDNTATLLGLQQSVLDLQKQQMDILRNQDGVLSELRLARAARGKRGTDGQ